MSNSLRRGSGGGTSIVVTGGGRGIGRAIALAFAEPEAHVIITGRTPETLDKTAGEIRARGARATTVAMDVADAASVAASLCWAPTSSGGAARSTSTCSAST